MNQCPVCKENLADSWSNVDVYSDTTIVCCADCRDLLTTAMRHQFNYTAPKKWLEENREKLNNAVTALHEKYQSMASDRSHL